MLLHMNGKFTNTLKIISEIVILLSNTDRLQQVEDYVNYIHFVSIIVSVWSIKKYCILKPLNQTNRTLVGSIRGRSYIKIAHFVPICLHTRRSNAILVYSLAIKKKHEQKFGRKHL